MQKRFVAILIAVLVAAGAGLATAQERFGGLTGMVTDASGAVLPGATVTITSKTTGAARTVVTASDGVYNVPDLDPGRYAVVVELSGFAKVDGRRRDEPGQDAQGRRAAEGRRHDRGRAGAGRRAARDRLRAARWSRTT